MPKFKHNRANTKCILHAESQIREEKREIFPKQNNANIAPVLNWVLDNFQILENAD
jgi:hypothetical protein